MATNAVIFGAIPEERLRELCAPLTESPIAFNVSQHPHKFAGMSTGRTAVSIDWDVDGRLHFLTCDFLTVSQGERDVRRIVERALKSGVALLKEGEEIDNA